jgi:hypothetical protein
MEPDQIDVLALAVLCSLEEIDDALEAGLLSQAWSDIRETDREDRIHLDRALSHAVDTASLDVRTSPDPDAAGDRPAANSLAQAFGEHHEPSLRRGCRMATRGWQLSIGRHCVLTASSTRIGAATLALWDPPSEAPC